MRVFMRFFCIAGIIILIPLLFVTADPGGTGPEFGKKYSGSTHCCDFVSCEQDLISGTCTKKSAALHKWCQAAAPEDACQSEQVACEHLVFYERGTCPGCNPHGPMSQIYNNYQSGCQ